MDDVEPSEVDLEVFSRVENEPAGTFKKFSAEGVGTESNIAQHLRNLDEVTERIRRASDAGCFIEVISIRLQVIDFWLRVYCYNVPNNSEQREREFGRLLKQTFRLGLDKQLYDALFAFNKNRVDAIHGFLIGATSYETISAAANEVDDTLRETVQFVVRNSGYVVTSRDDLAANPGAMVIDLETFCEEVRDGKRY